MANGQYGEGNVQAILDKLLQMKQDVAAGNMTLTDFNAAQQPLIKQAIQNVQTIAGQGSKAASAVNPIWNQLQQEGFVTARGGQWVSTLPFSQQEYAKLPNEVLPTQDDVKKGLFDPNAAPSQRFRSGGSAPTTGGSPQPTDSNGTTLPGIDTGVSPGIDTRTDQGQIALQGSENAGVLQDVLNKQFGINQQAVEQLGKSLAGIPDVYRQEGISQQNQLMGLADQQKSARSQALTDLGSILANNQMNLFNRAIPDLAEQANAKGIYQSTGFGDILANKYRDLTIDTQNQLALQGISDRDAYLQAQQNALGTNLGFSGQAAQADASRLGTIGSANAGALQAYGAGLGDVANAKIGMENAGLQRQFSLQDYAKQYADALNLANASRPSSPTGKASQGTQAWTQGTIGAVNAGANLMKAGSGKGAAA